MPEMLDEQPRRFSALTYLEESRRPVVSLAFILPILVLYEVGIQLLNLGRAQHTVNAADAILKHSLAHLGFYGALLSALCIVLTLVFQQVHSGTAWRVRPQTLTVMLFESALVALPLFPLHRLLHFALPAPPAGVLLAAGGRWTSAAEKMILSLGAGLYEEYLFRLVLLGVFLWLGRRLLGRASGDWRVQAGAVLLSAILFAVFHHLGPLGDPFELRLFAFRTTAGIYFAWIYTARGFGIAVGCHTAYDLMVVLHEMLL